jgi:hypothetical protein
MGVDSGRQPIRLRATLPSDGTKGAVAEREYPIPPSSVPPARSAPQRVGGLPLSTHIGVIPSQSAECAKTVEAVLPSKFLRS